MEIIDVIINICKSLGIHKSIILQGLDGLNDETYQVLKYELNNDNINAAGYINEKYRIKINGQINALDWLMNKQEEYFIILFERRADLMDKLEVLFDKFGFKEEDYLFFFHKPVILKGDIEDYKDKYGNEIKGKIYNCEIRFRGWNSKISIDESVSFDKDSVMALDNDCNIKFGRNISFGQRCICVFENSSIILLEGNILFEDEVNITSKPYSKLMISKDSSFNDRCWILPSMNTEINIGYGIMASKDVSILSNDAHPIYDINTGEMLNFFNEKLIIGNHVWLGLKSTVMGETVIGDDCIIGAHSLVKDYKCPNNCILAGTPAKVIRENVTWKFAP